MPRPIVLIVLLLLLLAGGAYFLSTLPRESPTRTIEVDVAAPANAS